MLSYPVRPVPEDDETVLIIFPDIPEAVSRGTSEEEAFNGALAALETALAGYVADGRSIPKPSDICGAPKVTTQRFSAIGLEL